MTFKKVIFRPFATFVLSKMALFQLSLLSVFVLLSHSATEENTTLLLVQTLFRHGDRAPIFLYPTDPNNASCWPNGLGRLTQIGKMQHYHVGKFLRSMYADFVTSDPNQVYANSSSEERCLNSAEANLASFYAAEGKWKISNDTNWQPIPIHYLPASMDKYLDARINCPRSDEVVSNAFNSNEIQGFYQTHQTMVENVSNYSGVNYSNPVYAFYLFDTLQEEKRHNLIIPEWADTYWNEMNVLSGEVFRAFYDTPVQLTLRMGPFLGLVTDNLKNKINGRTPNLKFIINSSHDLFVAGVLRALNFTDMPRPPYCATLLIELHEMADTSMTVRLLYMNSTNPLYDLEEPHVLVLDDCSEFCPVEYFMESYQWLIPNNWSEECETNATTESISLF